MPAVVSVRTLADRLVMNRAWQPTDSFHVRVISVGDKGIFVCPVKNRLVSVLWCRTAQLGFAADKPGPTSRLSIAIQRCNKPSARSEGADQVTADWATATCRRSRNRCDGRPTIGTSIDTTDMRISQTMDTSPLPRNSERISSPRCREDCCSR